MIEFKYIISMPKRKLFKNMIKNYLKSKTFYFSVKWEISRILLKDYTIIKNKLLC